MSEYKFSEFSRQNILGVIVLFTQSVRRMLNAFLFFFATTLFTDGIGIYSWILFGLALVFMIVSSILRYKNFRFKITDTQLILNSGILTKEVTNIPLDRIQSVHLHQNFIQRILGITGLKIDTAGSVAQELEIPALKKAKAQAMRVNLSSSIRSEVSHENIESEVTEEITEEKVRLVDLGFKALFTLAITENHVRNGFVAIAFIFGYLGQYVDYSEEFLINTFDEYAPELVSSTFTQIVVFLFLFVVLSVLLSFLKVILQFFDFKASVDKESFHISAGLLKRNEYTVPLGKIQFLEWQTNFLRKMVGFESIKILQGKSSDTTGKVQLEIPACYVEQTNKVMQTIFPEVDEDEEFVLCQPNDFQKLFRTIAFSVLGLPVFGLFALASEFYLASGILYLGYISFVILAAKLYVESVNLWVNEEVIIYERGWLFPKRTVVKLFKLQSVDIKQSIFQKRRELCHLSFSTAAGGRSFRFFPEKEMEQLRDFLLFKTESHTGKWM